MQTIYTFMEHDHDRLDNIFTQFTQLKGQDLEQARRLFQEFKVGLQKHIVWEEEILFPEFEQRTGMRDQGPTAVMRMEHREIISYLDRIHDKILEQKVERLDELESELLRVLKAHNDKEENVLYPWIDNTLSDDERQQLFTAMQNVAPEKFAHL